MGQDSGPGGLGLYQCCAAASRFVSVTAHDHAHKMTVALNSAFEWYFPPEGQGREAPVYQPEYVGHHPRKEVPPNHSHLRASHGRPKLPSVDIS